MEFGILLLVTKHVMNLWLSIDPILVHMEIFACSALLEGEISTWSFGQGLTFVLGCSRHGWEQGKGW